MLDISCYPPLLVNQIGQLSICEDLTDCRFVFAFESKMPCQTVDMVCMYHINQHTSCLLPIRLVARMLAYGIIHEALLSTKIYIFNSTLNDINWSFLDSSNVLPTYKSTTE